MGDGITQVRIGKNLIGFKGEAAEAEAADGLNTATPPAGTGGVENHQRR